MTLSPELVRERARDILRRRLEKQKERQDQDVVDWAHANFYAQPVDGEDDTYRGPIRLALFQQGVLRVVLQRHAGRWRYSTGLLSSIKKTGKTTLSGIIARYFAEVRAQWGEIYCIGNDFDQARDRAFAACRTSIKMTPGVIRRNANDEYIIPGAWHAQKTILTCLLTGCVIKPIAVDARGEAGGNPNLTVWTELWGFEYKEALDFWNEMTPVPTRDSMRLVETYVGYDGESHLLRGLFDGAQAGRQMTNHEFALIASRTSLSPEMSEEDVRNTTPADPDDYTRFLGAFEECEGNPDALVPIWVNDSSGICMYYDEGLLARRMPWLKGERGAKYYREQEATMPTPAFQRMHLNQWVGGEGEFVPLVLWDSLACRVVPEYTKEPGTLPPFLPGDKTPCVLGVDAATSNDCFGIVAVTRHPANPKDIAVRAVRRWEPPKGGHIDYSEPEAFIRLVVDQYNVQQVAYDPYQLESMMQTFRQENLVWCEEFAQGGDRLTADRALFDLIVNKRIWHDGSTILREHMANANAKVQKDEDSKMRIVKRAPMRKVDLVVALSMAAHRCLYLNLG